MISQIIQLVLKELEDKSDYSKLEFYKTSHPTSMNLLGVKSQDKKEVIKKLKLSTKELSTHEQLEIAKELVKTNVFECQQVAYEFIGTSKTLQKSLSEKDIDDLMVTVDNWVTVDCLGIYIVGPSWRIGNITTEKVKSFLRSDNQWIRRLAVVSTVALNLKSQGGTGDVKRTIDMCTLAIDDHSDMVVKAMSWALRELSKTDKKAVKEFIDKYNNRLHKRVLREVTHKLVTGRKN